MKKILILLSVLIAVSAMASNYPTDYCNQSVSVQHEGPLMVASVASGCFGKVVFGYKKSGLLVSSMTSKVDLVVKGICEKRGVQLQKQTVVVMGREWHGTGYMSSAMNPYKFAPDECSVGGTSGVQFRYEFAFSDGQGNWDSRGGANYHMRSLFWDGSGRQYKTNEAGDDINMKAWDIIVSEMSL